MSIRLQLVALLPTAALLLCRCAEPGLAIAAGELRVDAGRLEFPRTFVGHPTTRPLAVENDGRAPLEAEVSTDAPFSAGDGRRIVPPGTGAWEVRFDPPDPGVFEAILEIDVGGVRRTVVLAGVAEAVPDCVASVPCRTTRFDAAQGRCIELTAEDGSRCAAECIDDARCVAGACVGRPLGCDDGNACTADACEPGTGCVHRDTSAACAAPADPCRAAFCDPATGCGEALVVDGTRCGPADCSTRHVCLAGRCSAVATPDGTACADGTPCREPGTCRAGSCAQPAPRLLAPAWRIDSGAKLSLVSDADGHLYWLEFDRPPGEPFASLVLMSATRDGLRRFGTDLGAQSSCAGPTADWSGYLLTVGDHVVVAGCAALLAFRRDSGELAWRVEGPAGVAEPGMPGPMALDGAGRLLVRWPAPIDAATERTAVLALSPANGAELDSQWFETDTAPLLTDDGERSVLVSRSTTGLTVHAHDASGQEVWRRDEELTPVAAYGDTVFSMGWQGAVALHAANGNEAYRLPIGPLAWRWERSHVVGAEVGFALGQQCGPSSCAFEYGKPAALLAFEPRTGVVRANRMLEGNAHGPLLLSERGSVVFAGDGPGGPVLREIDGDGSERFTCRVARTDADERLDGPAVLLDGLYVVAGPDGLRGYPVPGVRPADTGWVSERGSRTRDGRPR